MLNLIQWEEFNPVGGTFYQSCIDELAVHVHMALVLDLMTLKTVSVRAPDWQWPAIARLFCGSFVTLQLVCHLRNNMAEICLCAEMAAGGLLCTGRNHEILTHENCSL